LNSLFHARFRQSHHRQQECRAAADLFGFDGDSLEGRVDVDVRVGLEADSLFGFPKLAEAVGEVDCFGSAQSQGSPIEEPHGVVVAVEAAGVEDAASAGLEEFVVDGGRIAEDCNPVGELELLDSVEGDGGLIALPLTHCDVDLVG